MRREVGRAVSAFLFALWLLLPPAPVAAARAGRAGPPAGPGPAPQAEPTPPSAPVAPEAPKAEAAPGEEVAVLSLQDCLKQALESNLDIAVRRYDPLKSETGVTLNLAAFDPLMTGSVTKQEQQFPRPSSFLRSLDTRFYTAGFQDPLSSGGNYALNVQAFDDTFTSNVVAIPQALEYNTSWQLSYTQPLLRNFGRRTNLWLVVTARTTLDQSASRFRQQVMESLAAAEKAYWDLNFSLMNLKTQRTAQQLARNFLEENRIKVRVGTLAPIEITQAEAGVADREEAVIEAENVVRTSEDAVRRIINVPRDSPLWSRPIQPSDAPPLVEVTPSLEEAVTAAEARRPDLEQARLDVKNRETELAYRKNQRKWELDFQGSYNPLGFAGTNYNDSFRDLGDVNHKNWSIALNLSVPIGNRQAVANYTNAEYGLEQARYTLENLEQGARVEVRNAVRTVET
ncbi:MAG TPA: TolC family protein, partial [Candidatus Polarisedimenticolia bacterium]|nr:TolC family protein [Candidatus Polarisedimenticolia bacterium]